MNGAEAAPLKRVKIEARKSSHEGNEAKSARAEVAAKNEAEEAEVHARKEIAREKKAAVSAKSAKSPPRSVVLAVLVVLARGRNAVVKN